jgi:MFS family permease
MSRAADGAATGVSGARMTRGVFALLGLAMFINYIDRGNLATAAPLIKGELGLDNTEYGVLVSAFFWVYTPAQLFGAWLAARLDPYRALACGLALWSLATVVTGFANGFAVLLGLRVLLGVGESVSFPATSKILAANIPPARLGRANGFVNSGIYLGPAVGTFVGGIVLTFLGWRLLFVVFGVLSLLWIVPWWRATRGLSMAARISPPAGEPSFRELLGKRELWGASIGHATTNYPFYLLLSWLPLYLVKTHGFSLEAMGRLTGVVYALAGVTCLASSWIADRRVAAGATPTRVRLGMILFSHALAAACMLACALGGIEVTIVALLAYALSPGLGGFNLYAIAQTLAGPRAAGRWMGLQNALGNIPGILAPIITGRLIDWTGGYSAAFLVAAVLPLAGIVSWLWLVRRVAPVTWSKPPTL